MHEETNIFLLSFLCLPKILEFLFMPKPFFLDVLFFLLECSSSVVISLWIIISIISTVFICLLILW